jgi:restriction system protein
VDFVLERGNRRQFVAARRWKSAHIGVEPLRALQAAREAGDGDRVNDALYIGLGEPSEAARQLATAERIAVWRGDEIALALRGLDLKA